MRDDGVTKYLLSYFGKRTDDVKTLQFYGNVCVDYGLNMILLYLYLHVVNISILFQSAVVSIADLTCMCGF